MAGSGHIRFSIFIPMTGFIQSDNAVLMLFKDDWVPFVCTTDLNISLSADVLPVRTPGAGHWAKNAYQKLNYTVSISSVLIYDQPADALFTGMDMLSNVLGFTNVKFRIAYTDDQGDIKSVQGSGVINGVTWSASTGAVVKGDISIVGDGELKFFDGLIPCDSTITSITVTGQTAADGIVHVNYTYSGAPYQIKWRVDGVGNYIYTNVYLAIDIPSLSLGSHSIELIPVCLNGYESDNSASQAFVVTQALTCSTVITDITITSTTATPVFTGTAPSYNVRIDGGPWRNVPLTPFTGPTGISTLSVGPHTIEMVPVCANNVLGTGFVKSFTVASQPAQSIITYNFVQDPFAGQYMQIYVNGVLQLNLNATASGTIVVATGAAIRTLLYSPATAGTRHLTLSTQDTTLGTTLDSRNGTSPVLLQFNYTANGDNFLTQGTISP